MAKSENFRVNLMAKMPIDPTKPVCPMETRDITAKSRDEAADVASSSEMRVVRAYRAKPRSEQNY